MDYLYIQYLAFAFVGTVLLAHVFKVPFSEKQKKTIRVSLLATMLIFTLWDSLAVGRNHWSFGQNHMIGIWVGNQPLEEILFFLIIPFFGLVCWEIFGKKGGKV